MDLGRLADALGPDRAPMMWLGAVLGFRWAEAAALTVGAIDALGGTVRTIAAPGWLVDDLAALLARRGLNAADGEALVFVNSEGGALSYSNWRRRVWIPACAAAGLAGLKFHDLRAANATAVVAAGVDVKMTQRPLGHSSPRVTLALHARATAAGDRAAADLLGARLHPRYGPDMAQPGQNRRGREGRKWL